MAKHPHKIVLIQKKTWKCVLSGCKWFVHVGLQHTLPGKIVICWGCGTDFEVDEGALEEDKPRCTTCRAGIGMSSMDMSDIIETRLALSKAGVKSADELTPAKRMVMKATGILTNKALEKLKELKKPIEVEKDEIEVIEADEEHAPDCDVFRGMECSCKQ